MRWKGTQNPGCKSQLLKETKGHGPQYIVMEELPAQTVAFPSSNLKLRASVSQKKCSHVSLRPRAILHNVFIQAMASRFIVPHNICTWFKKFKCVWANKPVLLMQHASSEASDTKDDAIVSLTGTVHVDASVGLPRVSASKITLVWCVQHPNQLSW